MTLWQALILGVVQGLTEFLPVSSSGHLVIVQHFFGLKEPELLFDALVHLGTLSAVFIFFRADIADVVKSLGRGLVNLKAHKGLKQTIRLDRQFKFALFIIIGTIPTVLIGVLFKDIFEEVFGSITWIAVMLMVTGGLLWIAEKVPVGKRGMGEMNIIDSLLIGSIQGLAITPGISRSGSTIACGLYRGIDRVLTVRYSFLLSIPVILGAVLFQLAKYVRSGAEEIIIGGGSVIQVLFQLAKYVRSGETGPGLISIALGTLAAALTGYFTIKILIIMVKGRKLRLFAYYCWILGLIVLLTR